MIGLYSVLGLFLIHFSIFVMGYALPNMEPSSDSIGRKGRIITFGASRRLYSKLSPWMTRIFIVIVILCTAIYLTSAYPEIKSPFWLGIVLQFFIWGSAALCYASWRREPHDV